MYPSGYQVQFCRRIIGADVSLQFVPRLFRLLRWADVVHLTAAYSFPTLPTLFACRLFNKPIVWSPRGALQATHEWSGARRRRLKAAWEFLCDYIIRAGRCVLHVTSEQERGASLARIPHAGATIIRNGVEIPSLPATRDWLPTGQLRVLFLGRLDPKKGIENLLRAVALLRDRSVIVTVCGAGHAEYTGDLRRLTSSLGIERQVSFRGHVDAAAKSAAFFEADVCVAPSYSENFCMVIAEALAHGVPVIASTGTPWPAVVDNDCGEWVDNSPASLAASLLRMRSKPLADMGLRGRDWMKRAFGWDAIAIEMHALYASLIEHE